MRVKFSQKHTKLREFSIVNKEEKSKNSLIQLKGKTNENIKLKYKTFSEEPKENFFNSFMQKSEGKDIQNDIEN